MYVESPAGVGFSFSSNASDYTTGDNRTMIDSYNFLLNWFQKFPEFSHKHQAVYLSGESYGGHYVPQLAWTIMNFGGIEIDGFLVGNAWTGMTFVYISEISDDEIDTYSIPPFIYNHALCSYETWLEVKENCDLSEHFGLLTDIGFSEGKRNIRLSTRYNLIVIGE